MALVLVVEDDPTSVVLMCAVLDRMGHRCLSAAEGSSALASARSWRPDLVILDVGLPGPMTGLDVCRALRVDEFTREIPVLMLSGWAFTSDIDAGLAAGADDYLAKPYEGAELRARIETLLARSAHARRCGPPLADPPSG